MKRQDQSRQYGLTFGAYDHNKSQRNRNNKLRLKGLCSDACGRALATTWYCRECAKRRADKAIKQKRERASRGKCVKNCGRDAVGGWYCAECLVKKKRSVLLERYGLTDSDYIALHRLQAGRCAICHQTEKETGERLAVDHCHDTDEVRALLCRPCNTAIGFFKEDPLRMRRAAAYMESYLKTKRKLA